LQTFPELSGPYLGQEPPGNSPVLFAPGIVSTATREWSTAFRPDGRELFFGIDTPDRAYIVHMKEESGGWTEPVIASFSGQYSDYDLTMGPDGSRLYFTSLRPADGGGPEIENPDIWYVDRTEIGWGDPVRFPAPINTADRELYPSVSNDGYLYFFSSRVGGFGRSDVYRVPVTNGRYGDLENLGPTVNTAASEGDICVSPDGDYIVFASSRDEGFGGSDLYVSFRRDGGWTEARNLGAVVNTEHREFCPSVSRDGKYLFFTSSRPRVEALPDIRSAVREDLGASRGSEQPDFDIYWVDARLMADLRVQPQ
jgi:Tol biopolymer transport system component